MIGIDPRNPRGILWIASYPRSGNTWMRIFLYWRIFLYCLRKIMGGETIDTVRLEDVRRSERTDVWLPLYQRLLGQPIDRMSSEIPRLRPIIQMRIAQENKGVVLVKTHSAFLFERGYPTINHAASAGAVYIVRNPLDVAISYAAFSNEPIDSIIKVMAKSGSPAGAPGNAYSIVGSWSENVKSWTEPPHPIVLVVRYEDMVANPAETFASVARHLRLTPTDAQLQRAIAMTSFETLQAAERAQGFDERPERTKVFFREGRSRQWQDLLTPEQVSRIVDAHGETMQKFGYHPLSPINDEAGRKDPPGLA